MPHVKAAPPGARLPLLVFALALAIGTVLFVRLHVHHAVAAPAGPVAASPVPGASGHATP